MSNEGKAINPQAALEQLWKIAPLYAKAKAERVYIENFLRSKKSMLMKESDSEAIGAQERDAYASPDYVALVEGLRAAVEQEETLRWRLVSAEAAIEVWRSQEASNRRIDRGAE